MSEELSSLAKRAADLPRRPTDDPHRFMIPAELLPPGFAAWVDQPIAEPAVPRPAATVVLVREGAEGGEALLLRRPPQSGFAAGAWVFPGGVVDGTDGSLSLESLAVGRGPGWWAGRLGLADAAEATGYVVAALREAWEETGILLAEGEAPPEEELRRARRDLLGGSLSLADFLSRAGLRLATEDLLYIAHWITPEAEPRRYDTRFFLARVSPEHACELHGEELAEARWIRPADAVESFRAGELRLLPPTAHTLRRLAEHPTLEELWEALRAAPVPTFLPRLRSHPEGAMVEILNVE